MILILSVVLLAMFFKTAIRKGDRALIDLQLFKGKTFAAATVTQFMSNGIAFAGQMLIPIYLIRACGRSPSATGCGSERQAADACNRAGWNEGYSVGLRSNRCGSHSLASTQKALPFTPSLTTEPIGCLAIIEKAHSI